jgi:glycosyltransferase involved in cell wall biosynthesis
MKNILLLTTIYPGPLRPGTPVCHFFVLEWLKMGYNVIVVDFRSMFPPVYTYAAKLFPTLAKRFVGNSVEVDRNMKIVEHNEDGIHCYSLPIFKYIPHGKYPQKSIDKQILVIQEILKKEKYIPDIVIGHFYNPCMEIVSRLKQIFPHARTCVSLHEHADVIHKNYKEGLNTILSGIDVIGFRSIPIKNSFERYYGNKHSFLMCPSGTSQAYLTYSEENDKQFTNGDLINFIFVGQFIARKFPKVVVQALNELYEDKYYHLDMVGKPELFYQEVNNYVENKNLRDRVSFVGKIPRERIIYHYDNAQCFIMISKGEVFGLVYLEAMSRGCITIAGRNEGMEGIIKHGKNGFLCEPGDVNELKQIIAHINSLSKEEKEQISKNAMKTASLLSDRNVASSYINNILEPHSDDLIVV